MGFLLAIFEKIIFLANRESTLKNFITMHLLDVNQNNLFLNLIYTAICAILKNNDVFEGEYFNEGSILYLQ